MFTRLRSSEGFPHSVQEVRAERVGPEEKGYLECLVACALYCFWDFYLISLTEPLTVFASHDEWMAVISEDPAIEARATEWLPELKPRDRRDFERYLKELGVYGHSEEHQ